MAAKDRTPPMRYVFQILADEGTGENDYNEPAESLQPQAEIRAAIEWISGQEQASAGAQAIISRAKLTTRYDSRLVPENKLRLKGTSRIFEIETAGPIEGELPHLMELFVTERG